MLKNKGSIDVTSYGGTGGRARAHSTSNCLIFLVTAWAAQTLKRVSKWLPTQKYIQAYKVKLLIAQMEFEY